MEFRVLGPLEVVDGRGPLDLGGPKHRTLMAALLLEPNRIVSCDRLIEALWEDDPPDRPLKALQVYISQLRKVIGKDRVETAAPGYRLCVEQGELDLMRFVHLAEEGRTAEALALWRGPPLSDFAYRRFAGGEIARLEELRLACLEEQIEAGLADGRHRELIGELEALVREHPLSESIRVSLILALYRSGRQAEALEAYASARSALVDELGIEPSRRLRDLQQAILTQDPVLDAPVVEAPPSGAPSGVWSPTHGPSLTPPEPVAPERRRTVTVLSVAVEVASAEGRALDPEALRRLSSLWSSVVEKSVVRHGGTVEVVASEVATAVFGFPRVHEDDPMRGVRASVELRDGLAGLARETSGHGLQLTYRIGLGTGEVVAGGVGGGSRTSGEPLFRASRLQEVAGVGEIALDDATRRLVRDQVAVEESAEGFRLVALTDAPPRGRRFASPMIGRARERRQLLDAFERTVADRTCLLFTILGAAGVGKSRLLQEFVEELGDRCAVVSGRCLPYGEGITFWPLYEAVTEAAGLDESESAEEARARLERVLAGDPDAHLVARRVAGAIGLGASDARADELFAAVRAFFEAVARARPLVLVFDDIHWGETTFLDLVDHLADLVREVPLLLVCLARPELLEVRPAWGGGKLNAASTLLEPLTDQECGELIENLVGSSGAAYVAERIAAAAEGNPLFVEEMLSMLIDEGMLVRDDLEWTAAGDLSTVPVPPTIQALLAARLERLGDDERSVLERASVVGKVFQEGAVHELADEVLQPLIGASLASLVRKELIRPDRASLGQQTFRFRHLLIRDSAYDGIPKEVRAGLHERFARWFEQTANERGIEVDEVVGYHLEQSYRYRVELGPLDDATATVGREGAERLGLAGRRALTRGDSDAGLNLLSRAADLLPPTDPLLLDLVPTVRVVQGARGRLAWADRVLTEAVEAAATSGDRGLAAHALVQRGLLRLFTEPDAAAGELIGAAERAIPVFEDLGDELGLSRAWRLIAQAHYLERRAAKCADASELALEHARRLGNAFEEREIGEWLAVSLFEGPTPVGAVSRRCERLARETSDVLLETCAYGVLAMMGAMQGRFSDAYAIEARGRAMTEAAGVGVALFSLNCAYVDLWNGDPPAAEAKLRGSFESLQRLREGAHFNTIAGLLAEAIYAQGRYDDAELMSHVCEEASRPNDIHSQILWRSVRAKVRARRSDAVGAIALAREAVAQVAESDFVMPHSEAMMDLGEVLALLGERQEALAAFEKARLLHEQKGNLTGVQRVRRQLVRLGLDA